MSILKEEYVKRETILHLLEEMDKIFFVYESR